MRSLSMRLFLNKRLALLKACLENERAMRQQRSLQASQEVPGAAKEPAASVGRRRTAENRH